MHVRVYVCVRALVCVCALEKLSMGWGDGSVFKSPFKLEGLSSIPRTHIKMLGVEHALGKSQN